MHEAMAEPTKDKATEKKGEHWVNVREEFSKGYSTTGIQVGGIRRKGRRESNRC